MRKQFKKLILAVSVIFLTTCGIEEYYYLPQVTSVSSNFGIATIDLPAISSSSYWARYYSIFYRIYLSNIYAETVTIPSSLSSINSSLYSDYNSLYNVSNPVNTSAIPNINTFKNLYYYEVEFEGMSFTNENILPKTGGEVVINFPTSRSEPTISLDGGVSIPILRSSSSDLNSPNSPYPYFLNSPDSVNTTIADVASSVSEGLYAYVCMYIVAVGQNPDSFQPAYGKPTLIDVFLIPNY